ncbi:MAG: hypothetical protein IPP94_05100 [Ignavibacteria bacterium]|nr:hypothetical protein [Ignavibacteria bacterium]
MISDFEQRLANVLGGRVPAPFAGRVSVAPAPAVGADPSVVVRVDAATRPESGMGGETLQVVQGSAIGRRIVRLSCTVEIRVVPAAGSGRAQQMLGIDAVLYALDAPEFRNGSALAGGAPDPGFLIQSMVLKNVETPPVMLPSGVREDRAALFFDVDGWFWPVGTTGAAGPEIEGVRIRGALTPLALSPDPRRLQAGGAPVDFTLQLREAARAAGGTPTQVALRLIGSGGGPGEGTLVGAVGGLLLLDVASGQVAFTYAPPANPARLELLVSLDDGQDGPGLELGRFSLVVK